MPETAATTATRSATSAVASLTRLSPSTIVTIRRGTPSRREIAVAAIGSVGATTAPSTNARRPVEPDHGVGDDRDRGHRHQHEPDRQQADRPRVRAQIAQRGEERRGVEQRRQHADEHELGRQLEVGDPRHESERETAEDEQDRIRDPRPRGERQQRRGRRQEAEQNGQIAGRELVHPNP